MFDGVCIDWEFIGWDVKGVKYKGLERNTKNVNDPANMVKLVKTLR